MEDNKGRMGTYYLVSHAGMIRASGTAGKNEKNRKERERKRAREKGGKKRERERVGGRERDCLCKEDALQKRR